MKDYNKENISLAKILRKNMTPIDLTVKGLSLSQLR